MMSRFTDDRWSTLVTRLGPRPVDLDPTLPVGVMRFKPWLPAVVGAEPAVDPSVNAKVPR